MRGGDTLIEMKLSTSRVHNLKKPSFMVVVVWLLWVEGHWEFYCNLTCHFSEYHGCLMHFQFPTSTNFLSRISIHNMACLSNCMVPRVIQLRKTVLIITTCIILLNYYLLYYKRDVRNKLLTYLLTGNVLF